MYYRHGLCCINSDTEWYVNGGIRNEHNDQVVLDGVFAGYRTVVNFERFLGHVTDICTRMDETEAADQALARPCLCPASQPDLPWNHRQP